MAEKKPDFPVTVSNLKPGMIVDIRALEQIAIREKCEVVVYFEEELARNSSYEKDQKDFENFEEHERPFILVEPFLKFQREMNPLFDEALRQIPLGVTIIRAEQIGKKTRITGLLPFLDEMDVS
ncbi:MAG: hypothetical protein GXY48_03940 [Methanomicrobiales archaeon]|nr:hypothetical protein [Methanomicrobiales archaeon]